MQRVETVRELTGSLHISLFATLLQFRNVLSAHKNQFSGAEQHDSQEFLNELYDGFHEDLNRVYLKPLVPPISDEFASKESLSTIGEEVSVEWRKMSEAIRNPNRFHPQL